MTIHEEKRHANIRVSRKNQVRFEMFNNHVDGEDELMTKTESQKKEEKCDTRGQELQSIFRGWLKSEKDN